MLEKLRQLPRPLYFLFAGTTITRMGAFVFPYLTIYLTEARQFGADRVGVILSVGSIGLLSGNLAGGWLTDHWNRKGTLLSAIGLNAVGFAGLAAAFESGWLYAVLLFVGYAGSGMYAPAANTVVADLTDRANRPFAYTVNYVCINLGMALGPLIAGFLAAWSYQLIFLGDVATTLVCGVLILVGLSETRRAPAERSATALGGGYLSAWRRYPIVLIFCLLNFFLIAPLMGLEYSVPLLVKTAFGQKLLWVGVIYTINAVCILSLSFLIERLLRGRNEVLMMVVAGGFWVTGLIILVSHFSITALIACTAVWTVGEIIASILVPSFIAQRVAPAVKGRFMALIDIVRSLAGVVCPIGLGLVWEFEGPEPVVLLIACLPAIGVVCYFMMFLATSIAQHGARLAEVASEP